MTVIDPGVVRVCVCKGAQHSCMGTWGLLIIGHGHAGFSEFPGPNSWSVHPETLDLTEDRGSEWVADGDTETELN